MRSKIFIEFFTVLASGYIRVPIHICYIFISQFTTFEDLQHSRISREGSKSWGVGNDKDRKGSESKKVLLCSEETNDK